MACLTKGMAMKREGELICFYLGSSMVMGQGSELSSQTWMVESKEWMGVICR